MGELEHPSRTVLLVAYAYPPAGHAGGHRPAAMAKYLRRLGHHVTVLTTSAYGHRPEDSQGDGDVVRTADLRLLRARLRGHRMLPTTLGANTHPAGRFHPVGRLAVPDRMLVAWAPFAVRAAIALHRARSFDVVITTSPPESTHVVGRALAARNCVWIADLRDGWTFEPVRPPFPTRLQTRIDSWLEGWMLQAADAVTCVSRPVLEDLRQRLGVAGELVPNGFDPELRDGADSELDAARALLAPDRVSLVYTGRLGGYGRDPRPLVRALRELAAEEPEIAARLELLVAGPLLDDERELLDLGFDSFRVRALGALSHRRVLALQRVADVLLLLASPHRTQLANLKLYEYLDAARPILALAAGTEAGRIVAKADGIVVRADDPRQIRTALRSAARGQIADPRPVGLNAYRYPAPARRMQEAFESAIARSGGPREMVRVARRDRGPAPVAPDLPGPGVRRLETNPMISASMFSGDDGSNINGPSLIRAPDWLEPDLGRYLLYFAHHHGDHIRLAHADRLEGPWRIHPGGTLRLEQVPKARGHVASPDVHVEPDQRRFRMYFHAPARRGSGQRTFVARSPDAVSFHVAPQPLGGSYFRVFRWDGDWFAFARGGDLYRSPDGLRDFRRGPNPFARTRGFERIRHVATHVTGGSLWVYFSRIGDAPERILRTRIDTDGGWAAWGPALAPQEVVRPENVYEGGDLPIRRSRPGAATGPENALRDPAIFADAGRTYLAYSVAGESGLAIAELTEAP